MKHNNLCQKECETLKIMADRSQSILGNEDPFKKFFDFTIESNF